MGDKLKESIKALKERASELGYWPPKREWDIYAKENGYYSMVSIRKKSRKTWEELREEFGFEAKIKRYTADDCIRALQSAAEEYGPKLSIRQYEAWAKTQTDVPSTMQISTIFKTYANAKIKAGLIPNQVTGKIFTVDEILEALKKCAEEKGVLFTDADYEEWRKGKKEMPSIETIRKRLGSLVLAKEQLGLEYYQMGENARRYEENEWRAYFYDFISHSLSIESYKRWAKENNAPSVSVLFRRTGGHKKALLELLPIYIDDLAKSGD
ncbi:hypothetical protein [Caldifermentibacillus hisashii]|uniref:hypothetical protein n=1 Tax=Caldifermentibacillus hisashii TaxID=996558 RepID=UPI001C120430|nr:hypothetical protein [Caldifermentibacillus hisashii]MBU5341319.1 hypothetical protein [Caldifermentibacillus hisashii]